MEPTTRCLLLELPAELRIRIYEYALAPTGTVSLTSTRSKRFATDPILGPALLATCRQINKEAGDILYSQNTILITVDATDTFGPRFAPSRLPQNVLERLQNMYVLLDCTGYFSSFPDVDWMVFCALVSLKAFRLSIIHHQGRTANFHPERVSASIQRLLTEMLERIPRETSVSYGTTPGSAERTFLNNVVEIRQRGMPPNSIQEISGDELSTLAESIIDLKKGCQSGGIEDVYIDHHQGVHRRNRVPDMSI